ncbi:polyprenyl synthetase family protein [Ramlibacter rhizophilus]|uniref:Polyprenyl synthetase family protein n=2 Tax=Ramlibacter rhizophilus TaxID=1781167 RepID=A0A4Z0BLL9_9BURK|nr:polyprenyl synthetase family protein [Ramlibacter rhizophilus]
MRVAVLGPAKRLRPLLTLLAGEALGSESPALLEAACAVEFIHCASLVLDDLPCMDDAALRRGQPALHRLVGEDVALLATVGLMALASQVLARAPGLDALRCCRLVEVLNAAVGPAGLVQGQYRDLRLGATGCEAGDELNELKTGVLFAAALEMAAVVAGREDQVPALRQAALALGRAFQLRDDLDDAAAVGARAEVTLVSLLGHAQAQAMLGRSVERARTQLCEALPAPDRMAALMTAYFGVAS